MFWFALCAIALVCVSGGVLTLALCRAAALGDRQMRGLMNADEQGTPFYPANAGD